MLCSSLTISRPPNATQNITIDINPPANVEAGSYKIPVRAATGTTSADLELEVVVTGSYEMELSTPRGLLSTEITAGDVKRIELVVRNTGSSLLKDIQLSANKPVDWEVSFEGGGNGQCRSYHESIQKGIARRLCGYHDGQNS